MIAPTYELVQLQLVLAIIIRIRVINILMNQNSEKLRKTSTFKH
jgi:hypothetical protein